MKKINFKEIKVKNIEDEEQLIDVRKDLGNAMYMQGQNIIECELGKEIWHSEGEIELTDEQVKALQPYINQYPYVFRQVIEEILK